MEAAGTTATNNFFIPSYLSGLRDTYDSQWQQSFVSGYTASRDPVLFFSILFLLLEVISELFALGR
jgi:hypothetical protein